MGIESFMIFESLLSILYADSEPKGLSPVRHG